MTNANDLARAGINHLKQVERTTENDPQADHCAAYDFLGQVDETIAYVGNTGAEGQISINNIPIAASIADDLEAALADNPDVEGIMPILTVGVPAVNMEAQLSEPSVILTGVDPARLDDFGGLATPDGQSLDLASMPEGTVIISEDLANNTETQVGDTLTYYYENQPHEVTVGGIAKGSILTGFDASLGESTDLLGIAAPISTVQELTGLEGQARYIAISNAGGIEGDEKLTDAVELALRSALDNIEGGDQLGVNPVKRACIENTLVQGATNITTDDSDAGWDIRVETSASNPIDDLWSALEGSEVNLDEIEAIGRLDGIAYRNSQVRNVGDDNWRFYGISGLDSAYMNNADIPLEARAPGFETDEAVWEAMRAGELVAIIDSFVFSKDGFGNDPDAYSTLDNAEIIDGAIPAFTIEMQNSRTGTTETLTVIGVIDANVNTLFGIFIPGNVFTGLYGIPDYINLFVRLGNHPAPNADDVAKQIEAALLTYGVQAEAIRDD